MFPIEEAFIQVKTEPEIPIKEEEVEIKEELEEFPCPQCGAIFADTASLSDHIEAEHSVAPKTKVKLIQCKNCDQMQSYEDFMSHIEGSCPGISYYRDTSSQKLSRRYHFNSCQVCGAPFSRPKYLLTHCLQEHNLQKMDVRPYPCAVCPKRFRASNILMAHQKKTHFMKKYRCTECPRSFVLRESLVSHQCEQPQNEKDTKIQQEIIVRKPKFDYPLVRVRKEKPPKKDIFVKNAKDCLKKALVSFLDGSETSTSTDFEEKKFFCEICNVAFSLLANLEKHMDFIHVKKEEVDIFRCDTCDGGFGSPWLLAKHQVLHIKVEEESTF